MFGTTSAATNSGTLGFAVAANPLITGVSLTLNNFDFTDEDAQARLTLSSLSALLSVNLSDPTSVVFPYQNFADQYSRQRVVYVTKQDISSTVYISKQNINNTVYITA